MVFLKLEKSGIWWKKFFSWNWFIGFHKFFWPGLFWIFWSTVRSIVAPKYFIFLFFVKSWYSWNGLKESMENVMTDCAEVVLCKNVDFREMAWKRALKMAWKRAWNWLEREHWKGLKESIEKISPHIGFSGGGCTITSQQPPDNNFEYVMFWTREH